MPEEYSTHGEHDEWMCAICFRPLDVVTDTDHVVQDYWHASGIAYGPEHEPVITKRDEALARCVCDFCSEPGGVWRYPATTFATPNLPLKDAALARSWGESLEPRSVGDWMACDTCHADIERGRWHELAKRSVRQQPRMVRPMMYESVRRLHREFVKNRTGPPRRIV